MLHVHVSELLLDRSFPGKDLQELPPSLWELQWSNSNSATLQKKIPKKESDSLNLIGIRKKITDSNKSSSLYYLGNLESLLYILNVASCFGNNPTTFRWQKTPFFRPTQKQKIPAPPSAVVPGWPACPAGFHVAAVGGMGGPYC